jgi:putative ABC transport system permease protein
MREYAAAFVDDARFGLRMMGRTPAFTAVALVMIALGTGANAAMFSVIDAVLLRSPFPDPARIAYVRSVAPGGRSTPALSPAQYRGLIESPGAFEAIGAFGPSGRPILRGLGEPRRMNVECVSAEMFKVLGTAPLAGRSFTADEDRAGGPSVVVLSYQFWQRDLGAAPDAVGRVVTLNGVPTTVVGIMPRSFGGPYSRNNNDGWLPLGPGIGQESPVGCAVRSNIWLFVRVRPGTSLEAAADQSAVAAGIERIPDGGGKTGARLALVPIDALIDADLRSPLFALLGSVGLVLLIACANVANLQMERVFSRRRDIAVRIAIGASRARLVRQTLTENLLLYVAGCAGGLLAARWTLDLVVALLPGYMPHIIAIEMNGRVLAATFGIACVAGLAVGLLPALQGSSPHLVDDLRVSAGTTRRARTGTRGALVVAQIALSLVLLVGAALMIRTFLTLRPANPGFTTRDKLTASIRLQGPRAPEPALFFETLLERVGRMPGVKGVTASTYLPVSGNVGLSTIRAGSATPEVFSGTVMPNYFAEMQIPVVAGRGFDTRDGRGAPLVAIVNEEMARRFGPGVADLGAALAVTSFDKKTETLQIVGIVRNTRSSGGDTKARPELYVPFAQAPVTAMNLIVRTANPSDPRLRADIREAVAAIDASQVADRFTPLADLLDTRVATWRFGAWLLGMFAGMALLLAAVGLAASIAWGVAQRTREIGVRMALGAETGQVTRMFLRQGLALTATGIVLGLAGAAASTRLLESWLYGVKPLDAPTFAWSAAGMLAVAALASYVPARRAARIDPLVTLRAE